MSAADRAARGGHRSDGTGPAAERLHRALLRPASVALVGASGDPDKTNGRPQRYLARHGYEGHVYPVNPGRSEIAGLPCSPSVSAIGAPVDHAFVMVPSDAVEDVIADCGRAGVPLLTILAAGFAEAGADGRARQDRLTEIAQSHGIRLLGPNSLGVIAPAAGLALSANATLERESLPVGRTAVISQSGSLIGALISRGASLGLGYSALVSVGNEADLGVGEIGMALVDDPATDAIVLFLETLRNAAAVRRMALAADAAAKPILAYRLGHSAVGRHLAATHTGAILGDTRARDAFLDDCGIIRLDTFEALIEAPPLMAGHKPRAALSGASADASGAGPTVAVMTTTGGGGALVADALGRRGIALVGPNAATRATLSALGLSVPDAPVLDLTLAGTRKAVVDAAIDGLMADPAIDAIAMVVGSSGEFRADLAVDPLLAWSEAPKPLAVFLFPEARASLRRLSQAGIATFRTPEACADALAGHLTHRHPRRRDCDGSSLSPAARQHVAALEADQIDEADALFLFERLGIRVPRSLVVAAGEDPGDEALSYPVVAKILSPAIAHKSDLGGVQLSLMTADAVRRAVADIRAATLPHLPRDAPQPVLLMEQVEGLGEAIVGFRRDPEVGPVVVVGAGGELTEVRPDVAVRPAPVSRTEAAAMIGEVASFARFRGFRGRPEGDLAALADIVSALSHLASEPSVAEAEINPVIVCRRGDGAFAVDGLLRLMPA